MATRKKKTKKKSAPRKASTRAGTGKPMPAPSLTRQMELDALAQSVGIQIGDILRANNCELVATMFVDSVGEKGDCLQVSTKFVVKANP